MAVETGKVATGRAGSNKVWKKINGIVIEEKFKSVRLLWLRLKNTMWSNFIQSTTLWVTFMPVLLRDFLNRPALLHCLVPPENRSALAGPNGRREQQTQWHLSLPLTLSIICPPSSGHPSPAKGCNCFKSESQACLEVGCAAAFYIH